MDVTDYILIALAVGLAGGLGFMLLRPKQKGKVPPGKPLDPKQLAGKSARALPPAPTPLQRPTLPPAFQPYAQPAPQPAPQPPARPPAQPPAQPTPQPYAQQASQIHGQPALQPNTQPTYPPSTQSEGSLPAAGTPPQNQPPASPVTFPPPLSQPVAARHVPQPLPANGTTVLSKPIIGRLDVTAGPALGQRFALILGDNHLGRGTENHISLSDDTVSGQHAIVRAQPGEVTLFDNASTNGTFVNGEQVLAPRRLQPGDQITLGRTALVYRVG